MKVIVHKVDSKENDESVKIVKMNDKFLPFTKERAVDVLEQDIRKKEHELNEAKMKLEYFLKYFNTYFINNAE